MASVMKFVALSGIFNILWQSIIQGIRENVIGLFVVNPCRGYIFLPCFDFFEEFHFY